MQTLLYTDTDKIRSVLGVDVKDVNDARITDRDPEKELRMDLLSWIPTHAALYAAGIANGASETQISISDALGLYSTYFCGKLVAKSLQLAAPQAISDGKNSLSRFNTIDWQGLNNFLSERAAFYKSLLQELVVTTSTTVDYIAFAGVGLAVDPVKTGV